MFINTVLEIAREIGFKKRLNRYNDTKHTLQFDIQADIFRLNRPAISELHTNAAAG